MSAWGWVVTALWVVAIATVVLPLWLRHRDRQTDESIREWLGLAEFKPAKDRPHIADMQARNRTPADIEWERRIARWTKAAREEDERRRGEAS